MPYQLQQQRALISTRRQQRVAPLMRMTSHVKDKQVRVMLVLTFFAAHVPLAFFMAVNSRIATLHAVVTITCSLWVALSSKKLERVAYAAAYITGAEVLWRMTYADSFWETGKYATALILVTAMLRKSHLRPAILPVLYFLLLLPSAALTLQSRSFSEARSLLSGDMSGPFALMIACCFFSQCPVSKESLIRLLLALIGPVIGVAAVAIIWIRNVEVLVFSSNSNVYASGGFGPNQVSAILGLGALAGFLIILERKVNIKLKLLCGAIVLFLMAQSALSFSRGGLFNVAGALVLASLFLLKDSRTRVQFILAVLITLAVSYFFIFPRLDRFTDGALSARFEDTDMTGREEIALVDLQVWFDNPLLGVGPGVAKEVRGIELGRQVGAHTEFTRLLAEHGILGLAALLILAGAVVRNLLMAPRAKEKAIVIALMGWSCFFMLNAGMRLVAPALMYGLAFALVTPRRVSSATTIRGDRRVLQTNRLVANYGKSLSALPQQQVLK